MSNPKFDITIDSRMINHSGIGTYLQSMIPVLVANFTVALLGNKKTLESFNWANQSQIIEAGYPIYSLSEQIHLPRLIPESKIFLSPHYNVPIRKVSAGKRIVIICDVNHLVYIKQHSAMKKFYARFMMSSAVEKSDKIVTISQFSKNEIVKHINTKGKPIDIIYFGIDAKEFSSASKDLVDQDILMKYGMPKKYLLYVGSLRHHKNLITALKAFNDLLSNHPKEKLVILGVKEKEFSQITEFKKYNNSIIIPGHVSTNEIPTIYRNAKCLIFPSYYEGFGLPPLEAMSCGCPVISSNAASLPEVCGDAALFFNPFDVVELRNKMEQIINDQELGNDLIKKGYENLKRFSKDKFVERSKHFFDSVIFS